MQSYCFKCKQQQEMVNPVTRTNVKGARYAMGACAVCGAKVTTIVSRREAANA